MLGKKPSPKLSKYGSTYNTEILNVKLKTLLAGNNDNLKQFKSNIKLKVKCVRISNKSFILKIVIAFSFPDNVMWL